MARLNQAQRADVQNYARTLVRGGVSRRRMDTILKNYSLEKYGIAQSIGKSAHSKLFHERIQQIQEREAGIRRGYTAPIKRRQSNYNRLISQHFLPTEARLLLSRLNRININEIQGMAEERKALYEKFLRRAAEENYSRTEFRREWHKTVADFYTDNKSKWVKDWFLYHQENRHAIRRKKRKAGFDAIWDWYGFIKDQLPPELQYDTPRKHRRKPQKPPTVDEFRVTRGQRSEQRIRNLQGQIDTETSPTQRAWLRGLLQKELAKR